ncbi:MAG: hypothetical protein A3G87_10395 [Omnitrophica bacterium RIFCSPLOWO2_12_FULL_50_11]|nr:MAG: hypothetical protein A3G87_10395 [Omnitrophica bacterium RIFCSPLOWO2_12_FULL_50_11]
MFRWLVNTLVASMIFFPTREYIAQPEDYDLAYEDAWPRTEDNVRIHGWFFGADGASLCLIFFHGNATNISGVLPYAKEWVRRGISVLLLDYRGYGQGEGSIKAGTDIFWDAEAGVEWLRIEKGFAPSQIILYGQSIGAAPAIELAAREKFRAAVLEAPFTSIEDLGRTHYGFAPVFLLKDFSYENEPKMSQIKSPLFILHGTEDEVCPFWMGKRLFELAPEPKEFLEIQGARHNDLLFVAGSDAFDRPFQFVSKER